MKKISIFFLIFLIPYLLSSCNSSKPYDGISLTNDLTPKTNYTTIYMTDVGTGFIHSKKSCLWYLDYETEIDIPFCSNPACSHNNSNCDAGFSGATYIYNGSLIDMIYEDNLGNEEWIDTLSFIKSDLNGQNRNTLSKLNCFALIDGTRIDDIQAYGDKLYLSCLEQYYVEGEEHYASPSHAKAYLAEISLETGETTYFSECLGDGWNMGISLRGIYNDELYFHYSYSDEYEGEYTFASELKWHSQYRKFNLKTHEITEISEEEYFYLYIPDIDGIENNCRLYCTDKEIIFETTNKKCRLYHDTPVVLEVDALLKKGNDIYFSVYANENSIFKYNMEEEKVYEAISDKYTKENRLYAVTDGCKYIFGSYNHLYRDGDVFIVGGDELEFKEISQNRFNEVCENFGKA